MSAAGIADTSVEVRIRMEDEENSRPFVRWLASDLDGVVPLLERWGLYDGENSYSEMSGQFVIDASGAYFEIVVHKTGD